MSSSCLITGGAFIENPESLKAVAAALEGWVGAYGDKYDFAVKDFKDAVNMVSSIERDLSIIKDMLRVIEEIRAQFAPEGKEGERDSE